MTIKTRRFTNVNVAYADFVAGESPGDESIDTSGNLYEWYGADQGWKQSGSGGASAVSDRFGSGAVPQNRGRTNVTTQVAVDWPEGAGIKFLSIFCWPYASNIDGTTKTDTTPSNVIGLIAIDPSSPLVAESWIGTNATTIPAGQSDDVFWYPIPLKQAVNIPLSAVMTQGADGGGQIYVRSSDGTTPLNFWVGAN
jgi:hypothetical protein